MTVACGNDLVTAHVLEIGNIWILRMRSSKHEISLSVRNEKHLWYQLGNAPTYHITLLIVTGN